MSEISKIEQYVIDKVRELRIKAGISQEMLSIKMELSSKFVGNVESSKRTTKYNLNHLNKIAEILGCSMKEFFPEEVI
ncbi:helix-turn-helix domain-containing protein [Pedobacter insulae]|uniref:Helix-turn-helix domain-containing protein n=1 Tax=Pedobacter insulae TaxID=414048 RepID=A0A1I2ZCX1_9SPHI|nr:helix-turn-helix transcriptional regulator [Pedobacter insulae]SFH35445.1 Helix-turn-helix domain-containing protein [Pedobacter insulae]